MSTHLPGTQVRARGLQWEVVHAEPTGSRNDFACAASRAACAGWRSASCPPAAFKIGGSRRFRLAGIDARIKSRTRQVRTVEDRR